MDAAVFQVPFSSGGGIRFGSRQEFDRVYDRLFPPDAVKLLLEYDARAGGDAVEYQLPFPGGMWIAKRINGTWLVVDLVQFA